MQLVRLLTSNGHTIRPPYWYTGSCKIIGDEEFGGVRCWCFKTLFRGEFEVADVDGIVTGHVTDKEIRRLDRCVFGVRRQMQTKDIRHCGEGLRLTASAKSSNGEKQDNKKFLHFLWIGCLKCTLGWCTRSVGERMLKTKVMINRAMKPRLSSICGNKDLLTIGENHWFKR